MPFLDSLAQDIRYALRNLRRAPVFTAVAILSIAGGLAAGTGIFAVAYSLVYRPLGVGDGASLHRIFTAAWSEGHYSSSSYADFEAYRESPAIASACATTRVRGTLTIAGAAAIHRGALVNPGCFTALRLAPHAGRFFTDEAGSDGGATPVVVAHGVWQRRLGGDPAAVGRTVELNGRAVTVVGVAPVGFAGTSFDEGAEFWAPIELADLLLPPGTVGDRRRRMFTIFARLADGVSPAQAEAALAVVAARQREVDPAAWTTANGGTRRVTVMPETRARFAGAPAGATIGILGAAIAAVVVIVAIACLNLSTMLLARGAARSRELAIRLAVGASRGRVLRQLATESLILATLGAALALAAVYIGVALFRAYRPPEIPAVDIVFDWRVLAFAAALATLASLLFGMAPALHALRIAVGEGLKGVVAATRVRRARFGARDALIVVQVAVSSALLLASTLFAGALARGTPSAPGFTIADVAIAEAHLDAVTATELGAANARLLDAASRVGDVDGVTAAFIVPMTGSNLGARLFTDGVEERSAYGNLVAPGYFATLGITLRTGRDFGPGDRAGSLPVAIISDSMARTLFGTSQAVGRRVALDSTWREVVGVVADIRYRALGEPPTPLFYVPLAQRPQDRIIVHARYRGGAASLAALERALREAEPRAAVERAIPLAVRMESALVAERATQWVGVIVGATQLFLALMALWGLVAYTVERRTLELGIRLALGATPASLIRLTMRPAALLILVGVAFGTVGGTAIAQVMQSVSVGLAPLRLTAVLPVAVAFAAVAMVAAWWPARRAGRADPVESLRRE